MTGGRTAGVVRNASGLPGPGVTDGPGTGFDGAVVGSVSTLSISMSTGGRTTLATGAVTLAYVDDGVVTPPTAP